MKDHIVQDFSHPGFQAAFKKYFEELAIEIEDWDALFQHMNEEQNNVAIVRTTPQEEVVGFIQFRVDTLKGWFFEETIGFVRELWIDGEHRHGGHGASLLRAAEDYFVDHKVCKAVLTTDTAHAFYASQGYVRDASYQANNEDDVYVKLLR